MCTFQTIFEKFESRVEHINQNKEMRVILQRVSEAKVEVENQVVGSIEKGFLLLVGIEPEDSKEDVEWLSRKICSLRIFSDEEGKMNLDLNDVNGDILAVSQFTLHAKYKKGSRPSFIRAAHPDHAIPIFEQFLSQLESDFGKPIESGKFGAMMDVSLVNDGPVTLFLDTKNKE